VLETRAAVDQNELARSAIERSRLYGLLATVFRHEPSVEFLRQMKTPELVAALANSGIDLGYTFEAANAAHLVDDLAIEYTRLFLGPGRHISPHESVQLKRGSGMLWGPETPVVRQAYRDAGFEIGESETKIPDHISVELDFLSLLTTDEAAAWEADDQGRLVEILKFQHSFIARHLGKWVSAFCTKVRGEAELPFYAAFAEILQGYLSGEKAEIVHRQSLLGVTVEPESEEQHDHPLRSINE